MADSLRDKQKQVARELILQAAADLIVEAGLESLSLGEVASRAGVSKRTLYNYFDSRETLLAAIGQWSDDRTMAMGGFLMPEGLATLPEVIQAVWRTWADQGTVHQAVGMIDAASSPTGVTESRAQRRAALASAIYEIRPDLGPDHANELAAVFHALGSAPIFERLTAQDGLSVETAGLLVGWTMTVMRDALENDHDPYQKEDQE